MVTRSLRKTLILSESLERSKVTESLWVLQRKQRDLIEHAQVKLKKKNLDLIVANNVAKAGIGFGVRRE